MQLNLKLNVDKKEILQVETCFHKLFLMRSENIKTGKSLRYLSRNYMMIRRMKRNITNVFLSATCLPIS